MREGLRKEKIEFARDCYALADLQSLERLKQELWDRYRRFFGNPGGACEGFILAAFPPSGCWTRRYWFKALKRGAEEAREKLNGRMRQERCRCFRGFCTGSWRAGARASSVSFAATSGFRKRAGSKSESWQRSWRQSGRLSGAAGRGTVYLERYPIPGRNKLLAPDLIAYVRQAVRHICGRLVRRRESAQIGDLLKTASQEASGKLGENRGGPV